MVSSIPRLFPAADPGSLTGQRLILASVSLASLLGALDLTIVNIANPAIIKAFQVSVGTGSLVILAYMLTLAGLIMIMGKLGDRFGFRPVFITGLLVFGTGSLLCGIALDIYSLIGSRILQAAGAAMFSAIGPAVITEFLPGISPGKVARLPHLPLCGRICTRPRYRRFRHPVRILALDLFHESSHRGDRHYTRLALHPPAVAVGCAKTAPGLSGRGPSSSRRSASFFPSPSSRSRARRT